jgi:hypothetical protein
VRTSKTVSPAKRRPAPDQPVGDQGDRVLAGHREAAGRLEAQDRGVAPAPHPGERRLDGGRRGRQDLAGEVLPERAVEQEVDELPPVAVEDDVEDGHRLAAEPDPGAGGEGAQAVAEGEEGHRQEQDRQDGD